MSTRRWFVSSAPLAAALMTTTRAPQAYAADSSNGDHAEVDALLKAPARHRQVFASNQLNAGAVLRYMKNALNAYQFAYAEGPGTLHPVAVLYGGSATLALDDAVWKKYNIASVITGQYNDKLDRYPGEHPDGRNANPFARPRTKLDDDAAPAQRNSLSSSETVEALVKRGAHFLVCDNTLSGLPFLIGEAGYKGSPFADVYADLRKHLLPGTMVVPAGVAAVNQAQEAGFTFFQA
jgi:hypothetical protein